jgi:arginine/lysine/ornithine decarboxylase
VNTPIHDFIKRYAFLGAERCHTPGHRGTLNLADITEIDGTTGIIQESERNAAKLFGAGRTLFSTGGSTLAIYAMLAPFAGERIAAARGAHRSLIDAAILLDLELVRDMSALDVSAVFITSIDYYGNVTPVPDTPLPVLVDNAHGAYLVFTTGKNPRILPHPIRQGAAMCADSAHKTLPALTGAAYLHISRDYLNLAPQAEAGFHLFGTSSPSFLILESLDLCNLHISRERTRANAAFAAMHRLKKNLTDIGYSLHESDTLRVVIDANARGYTGTQFARHHLRKRGIECEMCDSRYVVLLFSTITDRMNSLRVLDALNDIAPRTPISTALPKPPPPQIALRPRAAYFSRKTTIPTAQAVGEVCAGVHVTIPPCVPLIIPGEIVSVEMAAVLEQSGLREIDVVR